MVKRLAVAALVVVVLLALSVHLVGWGLSHPVQARVGSPPADLGAQAVSFRSASGTTISGWLAVAGRDAPVVLLLPGVRANRLSMIDRARFLRHAGYSVLLIDLQATGETLGDAITFGYLESRDVLAAVDFIRRQIPGARVAVIGSSLGGAAALLATPPLRVDAMILEAVYPTIEKATINRLRLHLGSFGTLFSRLLLMQLKPRLGVAPDQLRPIDHAPQVRCPVLVMAGSADRHTTPEDTQQLYAAFTAPKSLWLVPGAAHVDLHRAARAEYEARVVGLLRSVSNRRAAGENQRIGESRRSLSNGY